MELVREVRENGFECESRDGHVWLVWRKGEAKILAKFSRHPKNEGVLRQARQDLRAKNIIAGVGASKGERQPKKKEDGVMAMVTEEGKKQTQELVERLRSYLVSQGGDTAEARRLLSQRAVQVIEFRQENGMHDVEQFGSTGRGGSKPWEIARESLRGLLDLERSGTDKSNLRWNAVLDEINRQSGNGVVTPDIDQETQEIEEVEQELRGPAAEARAARPEVEPFASEKVPDPDPEPAPEAESDEEPMEPEDYPPELLAKLHEVEERASLAEGVVEDVERERDEALKARDEAREELQVARDVSSTALRKASTEIARLERLQSGEGGESVRDRYATILLDRLANDQDPGEWLLDRLDRLAGVGESEA